MNFALKEQKMLRPPEGTRPVAAPIPPPGVYWLKTTRCDVYYVDEAGVSSGTFTHAVYTWDLQQMSDWFIAEVYDHGFFTIASDESRDWEDQRELVTHVSARVENPDG